MIGARLRRNLSNGPARNTPVQNPLSVALISLLTVASLYVWGQVIADAWRGRHPLPMRQRPQAEWNPFLVVLVVGWVGFQVVQAILLTVVDRPREPPSLQQVQNVITMNATIVLVVWVLMTRSGRVALSSFGINTVDTPSQIAAGVKGFVASWIPVAVILLIAAQLNLRTEEGQHSFFKVLEDHPGATTIFWIFLAAVILAPLAEELVYRVVLQGWLQTWTSPITAIVLVAVVFSLVHGWRDALPLLPLALILGYVYNRTYSYWTVVTIHLLFNANQLTIALLERGAG
jgi:uncharacterized protein